MSKNSAALESIYAVVEHTRPLIHELGSKRHQALCCLIMLPGLYKKCYFKNNIQLPALMNKLYPNKMT